MFGLRLIAQDGLVFGGEVSLINLQTLKGQIGIMPGHGPMMFDVVAGLIEVVTFDGTTMHYRVSTGFAQVDQDGCLIMVDSSTLA